MTLHELSNQQLAACAAKLLERQPPTDEDLALARHAKAILRSRIGDTAAWAAIDNQRDVLKYRFLDTKYPQVK